MTSPVKKRRALEKRIEGNGIAARDIKRAFSPKTTKAMNELNRKKRNAKN